MHVSSIHTLLFSVQRFIQEKNSVKKAFTAFQGSQRLSSKTKNVPEIFFPGRLYASGQSKNSHSDSLL